MESECARVYFVVCTCVDVGLMEPPLRWTVFEMNGSANLNENSMHTMR